MSRKKVAVVLVVKDEAGDIACWLAWYHAQGFDACIVFDDGSTDGTWEIVERASKVQDIRLSRSLGPRDSFFDWRIKQSYLEALRLYGAEFEWMAFLDCDEYVAFSHDSNVRDFLDRFDDADGIAVNWCNYGSSNYALKPALLPIEAYTRHSDEAQMINRHVKSFVRPEKVGPAWRNMHAFDIDQDRYLDASHNHFEWAAEFGIMSRSPDWSVAKIMHYQCRSMEHFLERLRKRADLPRRADLWRAYDFDQVEDLAPLRLAPAVHSQIDRFGRELPSRPALREHDRREPARTNEDAYEGLVMDLGVSEGNDTAYYLAKGFQVVAVEADPGQYQALRRRFAAQIETGALRLLNFVASDLLGSTTDFFVHRVHQAISGVVKRDEVTDDYVHHQVATIDWRTLQAQAGTPRYLKISIEGNEEKFLDGLLRTDIRPEFVSIECYKLPPVEMLHAAGYRRFRLVDQNPPGGFQLPARQLEGLVVPSADFTHGSGPFGLDVFGDGVWTDIEGFRAAWLEAQPRTSTTWFDCHAWKPR